MNKQRGEIVTVLTVISLGLMLMGIVAGKFAVQQTTQIQSKAASNQIKLLDACNPDNCESGRCLYNGKCAPVDKPTEAPPTSAPDTQPPKPEDTKAPPPPTAVPDKKTDSCLNCSHGEGCIGTKWCGNDCQYHDDLKYMCDGSLQPSPTGPKACGSKEGCIGGRYCGNDGSWHDENDYQCNGSVPPSPTGPRGCGPKEGCVSGGRYCGNDGVFHDELDSIKGCNNGGKIGALPPTVTPKITPGSVTPSPLIIPIVGTGCSQSWDPHFDSNNNCLLCLWSTNEQKYVWSNGDQSACKNIPTLIPTNFPQAPTPSIPCDSSAKPVTDGKLCFICAYTYGGSWIQYPISACSPFFSPTPAGPKPTLTENSPLYYRCLETGRSETVCRNAYPPEGGPPPTPAVPTVTAEPLIPSPTPQRGWLCLDTQLKKNALICNGAPQNPTCVLCSEGTCNYNRLFSAVCSTTTSPSPTPTVIPDMPKTQSANASSWDQVQTQAVAGKVQANQISAWVYEAAQYYYPGIKHSFCNPMKRECDFRR